MQKAFEHIGLAYGDDGAMDKRFPILAAAKHLGLRMTEEEVYSTGTPYFSFIGRIFPHRGKPESMQDLGRAISKIGVVPRVPGVSPLSVLCARALCYGVTDATTPILGPLCRKIVDFSHEVPSDSLIETIRPYIGSDFPIAETWVGVDPEDRHVRLVAAKVLDLVEDLSLVEARLDAARSLSDLSNIMKVKRSERTDPSGYDSHSCLTVYRPMKFGPAAAGPRHSDAKKENPREEDASASAASAGPAAAAAAAKPPPAAKPSA